MASEQNEEAREKRSAALLSVGSAVLLVSLKAFLVIRTGSLGVLSEALHSGSGPDCGSHHVSLRARLG